jgi:CRP-like cAMP-binding protein
VTAEVSLAESLRTAEAFQDLPDIARWNVAAEMSEMVLKGEEIVARQGECTDALFVVIAGELAITCVDRLGRTRELHPVGPGRLLGGPGLLVRTPASVTARAAGPVRLAASIDSPRVVRQEWSPCSKRSVRRCAVTGCGWR